MKHIQNITTLLLAMTLALLLSACNTKTTQDENNTAGSSTPTTQTTEDTSATGSGAVTGGATQNGGTTASSSGTTTSNGGSSNTTGGSNNNATHGNTNTVSGSNNSTIDSDSDTGTGTESNSTQADTNATTGGEETNAAIGGDNDNNITSGGGSDDNTTTGGADDDNTTTGGRNDDNSTVDRGEDNTTTPTVTLKSLNLTVNKTSLNKDENTTVKVMATYSDNATKEVTDKVKWVAVPNNTVKVTNTTLTALQDKAITLKAKVGTTLSNAIDLNITWVVNGHRLPPEPDKALNDSTLLGIDTNNNGVRDDVERWIYEEYKDKHPIYIDIAMQAARGYRLVLEHPERAKEIHDEVDKAVHCQSYYKYYAEYFNEPILVKENSINEYVRSKIYFNTKERMDAYDEYDRLLSGDSYTLPKIEQLKAMCDFNTSKYEE